MVILVNDNAHANIIKVSPSRQNGHTVKRIRVQEIHIIKDVIRVGESGSVTVETELLSFQNKNQSLNFAMPSRIKIRSFLYFRGKLYDAEMHIAIDVMN